MKKRLLSILLTLCMVVAMMPGMTITANAASTWDGTIPLRNDSYAFSGGDGTSATPYLISTAADLAQLAANINAGTNYVNKVFVQTTDIDLNGGVTFTFEADTGLVTVTNGTKTFYIGTGTAGDGSGSNTVFDVTPGTAGTIYSSNTATTVGTDTIGLHPWTPIGTATRPFMGYFKGQSYDVRGIYINHSGADYQGLFGYAAGSISNTGVSNSCILGANYIGSIAGYASTIIRNCYNTGIVRGSNYVGGITGRGNNIQNSYNAGVSLGLNNVGGIAGYFATGQLYYSYSTGTVAGSSNVGIITGGKENPFITGCGVVGASQIVTAATSAQCAGGGAQTLLAGLTSGTSTLLEALNAWVSYDNHNYNYTWKAADGNTNGGYPVKDAAYVPATVPGAPTIGTATAGNTQASVSFTAPASNGGASITGYTVTSNPGGLTGTGAGSPITVTGLTNGVAYTFTVTATNSAGTGAASAASNSITPAMSQIITFNNPGAQNFGTTPTLIATADSGLSVTFTSSTPGVATITSDGRLTFISAGIATINANQAGNGSYLAATEVSRTFAVNAVTPGAPTIGTATAGNTQASVSFTAPASNGGASITGYTVTSNPGGVTATGAGSPLTLTGLTNGQAYTFTVTATNAVGTSGASSASNSVTPQASTPSGSGGGSNTPAIVTKIESGESVVNTNVEKLVKEGKDLTVEGKAGETLVFDTEALKNIDEQTKENVKVEIKDVSADYKDEHPDRLIVSLSITAGGKHITNFGNGTATVSLPYELKEGEKAEDVTVWYLAEDGSMSEVPCSYDPVTKLATFKVNHFSLYVVGTADTREWVNPFSDVKEGNWFYEGVRFVSANGFMQGTANTTFSPNAKITRGMLVTILWRMENQPSAVKNDSFMDVEKGKWYADAVAWAAENGIAAGYDGKFAPNASLTREQLASILYRYAKYKNDDVGAAASLAAYTDQPSGWALSSVSWAVAEGLLKGSNGSLDPQGSATRAQTASILQRFLENAE